MTARASGFYWLLTVSRGWTVGEWRNPRDGDPEADAPGYWTNVLGWVEGPHYENEPWMPRVTVGPRIEPPGEGAVCR